MLDNLLTITSTVAQQIDVLQKALGGEPRADPTVVRARTKPSAAPASLPRRPFALRRR